MNDLFKKWPLFAIGAVITIVGITVLWFLCFDSDGLCKTKK